MVCQRAVDPCFETLLGIPYQSLSSLGKTLLEIQDFTAGRRFGELVKVDLGSSSVSHGILGGYFILHRLQILGFVVLLQWQDGILLVTVGLGLGSIVGVVAVVGSYTKGSSTISTVVSVVVESSHGVRNLVLQPGGLDKLLLLRLQH